MILAAAPVLSAPADRPCCKLNTAVTATGQPATLTVSVTNLSVPLVDVAVTLPEVDIQVELISQTGEKPNRTEYSARQLKNVPARTFH